MPIYLKINNMDGTVTAKGHEKWIEVYSLNFDVNRNISTKPGSAGNREFTKPSISEIEILKHIDNASPHLFSEACVGKTGKAEIHVCKTGDTISPYVQYTLNNVVISHYSTTILSEHGAGLSPLEKIRLNFDKIEMKFIPYDEKNRPGSPVPAGYDLAQAQKI